MDLITRINALIDEEYESVKAKSATYGELKCRLKKVEREIAWEKPKAAEYIGERFQKLLDEDICQKKVSGVIDEDNAFLGKHSTKSETEQSAKIRGITIDLPNHDTRQEAEANM